MARGRSRPAGRVQGEFEEFVAGATDRLFRLGYLMTFDAAEAEGLVQETFWRTARHWDQVGRREQPGSAARRTLVALVLERASGPAHRRRRPSSSAAVEAADPQETSIRVLRGVDEAAEFRWALALLEPEQRAAIVLRYHEELSEAEAAEALGRSVDEVASATTVGVARLRRMLGHRPLEAGLIHAPSTGHPS
ncbi:MAG: sigma factor-like helix-turn-helix DNA-binding protein [Acidimicrobiales bacterium]